MHARKGEYGIYADISPTGLFEVKIILLHWCHQPRDSHELSKKSFRQTSLLRQVE